MLQQFYGENTFHFEINMPFLQIDKTVGNAVALSNTGEISRCAFQSGRKAEAAANKLFFQLC
jgi:hypothetical protein